MEFVSKSSVKLLKSATEVLKEKWVKLTLATCIYLLPLFLLALPYYIGFVLAVIVYGHITVGYIKYLRDAIYNQNPKLITIISYKPKFYVHIITGAMFAIIAMVGFSFVVVPGIIFIAYFGMTMFVAEAEDLDSPTENMKMAKNKVKGRSMEMISYKLTYYLLYLCVAVLVAICAVIVKQVWAYSFLVGLPLCMLLIFISYIIFSVITLHYTVANILFYDSLKTIVKHENKNNDDFKLSDDTIVVEQDSKDKTTIVNQGGYDKLSSSDNEGIDAKLIDNAIENSDSEKSSAKQDNPHTKKTD